MSSKRHIAFLTGTRADFGKIKPLIIAAHEEGCRVSVFATGMHMLPRFGDTILEVTRTIPAEIPITSFLNQQDGDTMDVVVANTITGGFGSSLLSLAARAARSTTMTDDVAEKVAKLLMSSEPAEVAAAVKLLEEYGQKAAKSSTNRLTREAGVIGGVTNVLQPDIRTDKPVLSLEEAIAQDQANAPKGPSQLEIDIAADIAAEKAAAQKKVPGTSLGN